MNNKFVKVILYFVPATKRDIDNSPGLCKCIYTTTDMLERYMEAYEKQNAYTSAPSKDTFDIVAVNHDDCRSPQIVNAYGQNSLPSKLFQGMSTAELKNITRKEKSLCILCPH